MYFEMNRIHLKEGATEGGNSRLSILMFVYSSFLSLVVESIIVYVVTKFVLRIQIGLK
jgi:hypothetical protein